MDEDHRRRGFAGFIHTDMMCSDIHQLARARRCCLTAAATRLVDPAEIQRALDLKVPCWRHVCMRPERLVSAVLFAAAFGLRLDEDDT